MTKVLLICCGAEAEVSGQCTNDSMVDIYLKVDNSDAFRPFLSIPLSDIQRLTIRPLKWIRFISFAICGSRGHLYETTTVNAHPVDYDNSNLVDSLTYYYIPEERCTFIDHNGLGDRMTSSELTQQQRTFCEAVERRDREYCVFTKMRKEVCDAAHIIPKSKGDKYIEKVIQLRKHLYDPPPDISDINDVQNGIFMNKSLHAGFRHGQIGLVKTPNFALNPDDIVWASPAALPDPPPLNRTTLQELLPNQSLVTFDSYDANFHGDLNLQNLFPPSILLDYMYGVAAYNLWKIQDIHPVIDQYFSDNYKSISAPPLPEPSGSDTKLRTLPHRSNSRRQGLEKPMNEMNFAMYISGITPQLLAEKRQMEEKQQFMEQEESQAKVEGYQWLQRVGEQLIQACRQTFSRCLEISE